MFLAVFGICISYVFCIYWKGRILYRSSFSDSVQNHILLVFLVPTQAKVHRQESRLELFLLLSVLLISSSLRPKCSNLSISWSVCLHNLESLQTQALNTSWQHLITIFSIQTFHSFTPNHPFSQPPWLPNFPLSLAQLPPTKPPISSPPISALRPSRPMAPLKRPNTWDTKTSVANADPSLHSCARQKHAKRRRYESAIGKAPDPEKLKD